MTEANPASSKPQTAAADEDLSAEIARTISRSPIEQVTCRRITRNHYQFKIPRSRLHLQRLC